MLSNSQELCLTEQDKVYKRVLKSKEVVEVDPVYNREGRQIILVTLCGHRESLPQK